jgi:hypothetical protein
MRKFWATTIATATLLLITACSSDGTIAPGEGLAPTPTSTSAPSETSTPGKGTPNFKEKYTYDDGVAIEITKIKTGHLTRAQAADEYDPKKIKAGMAYATFMIRVKNGSPEKLTLGGEGITAFAEVTYGPDGERATDLYSTGNESLSGSILPGRARTGRATYLIPERYWNDVVMEINIGDADKYDRDSVIFAGPIN